MPTGVYKRPSLIERLFSKVIKDKNPDGCWLWKDKLSEDGYAYFWTGVKNVPAHRVLYESMIGPIPEGYELDHLCRNRACVRPDHQEPVTHKVNLLRGVGIASRNASATHCPQGHPYDSQNTRLDNKGNRRCKICQLEALHKYKEKKKQGGVLSKA